MSREMEIKQGLREEGGALIGGLVVIDYLQGMDDFANRAPPPDVTSASYDLGRMRASEGAEQAREVMDALERRQRQSQDAVRAMLKDRPDLLAEFNAKLAEIDAGKPQ